jgi:hypothetical protein
LASLRLLVCLRIDDSNARSHGESYTEYFLSGRMMIREDLSVVRYPSFDETFFFASSMFSVSIVSATCTSTPKVFTTSSLIGETHSSTTGSYQSGVQFFKSLENDSKYNTTHRRKILPLTHSDIWQSGRVRRSP